MTLQPTKAAMKRAVEAMTEAGVEIGLVEISRDGSIRITPKGSDEKPKAMGLQSWD